MNSQIAQITINLILSLPRCDVTGIFSRTYFTTLFIAHHKMAILDRFTQQTPPVISI